MTPYLRDLSILFDELLEQVFGGFDQVGGGSLPAAEEEGHGASSARASAVRAYARLIVLVGCSVAGLHEILKPYKRR